MVKPRLDAGLRLCSPTEREGAADYRGGTLTFDG